MDDAKKIIKLLEKMIRESQSVNHNILAMTAVLAEFNKNMDENMKKTKTVRVASMGSVTGLRR